MNYKEENWFNDIIDRLKDNDLKELIHMDQDDFHDILHQEIDNMVIYNSESQRIVDDLNYDVFQEHDVYGRAEILAKRRTQHCMIFSKKEILLTKITITNQ